MADHVRAAWQHRAIQAHRPTKPRLWAQLRPRLAAVFMTCWSCKGHGFSIDSWHGYRTCRRCGGEGQYARLVPA